MTFIFCMLQSSPLFWFLRLHQSLAKCWNNKSLFIENICGFGLINEKESSPVDDEKYKKYEQTFYQIIQFTKKRLLNYSYNWFCEYFRFSEHASFCLVFPLFTCFQIFVLLNSSVILMEFWMGNFPFLMIFDCSLVPGYSGGGS